MNRENFDLYPEIHKRMIPFVDEVVAKYENGQMPDEQTINEMVQHVVNQSGMMRNPPRGHNRITANDFARFLILCRLLGTCPPIIVAPPIIPSVFPPVFPPMFPPVRPMPPIGFVPPNRPRHPQGNQPDRRPPQDGMPPRSPR